MSQLMISVSGIRGIVGAALTPSVVTHYAASFATWLGPGPSVFGRDSRPSGPALRHAVLAGLLGASGDDGHAMLDTEVLACPVMFGT